MNSIDIESSCIDNVDRTYLLEPLINVLKRVEGKTEKEIIPEINFSDEFPSHEVVCPEEKFSPKHVINYMIIRYECFHSDIQVDSDFHKHIIYKYFDEDESCEMRITFSNIMSFITDIFTISFLYHIQYAIDTKKLQIIYELKDMMEQKYNIQSDNVPNKDAITIFKVTQSFPSISCSWFHLFVPKNPLCPLHIFLHFINITFPGLPNNIICFPRIASIIPRIRGSKFVPIALLTAVNVKVQEIYETYILESDPNYKLDKLSLNAISGRIIALHYSQIFPESLKLKVCQKWGIVEKVGTEYKYADYFNIYFVKALNVIKDVKSHEANYERIISEIVSYRM